MIETTSEFKKVVKSLVKGAIKSKLFGGEGGDYIFDVTVGEFDKKEKKGTVTVSIACGPLAMVASDEVGTRVYNKVNDEFFSPIAEQFGKLKTINSITITVNEVK